MRGRVAVANAQAAFDVYQQTIASDRWQQLAAAGAGPQRPLWASTGTKNHAYSDVLYVESLIAPDVVNTMPQATLDAFADHGTTAFTLDRPMEQTQELLRQVERAGISLARVTSELEREGVDSFCTAYTQLLECIDERRAVLSDTPE